VYDLKLTVVTAEPSSNVWWEKPSTLAGRKTKFWQMTNSELMAWLPMAVCVGASIGIRVESVGLRIAFVGGAIVALDLEKQVLHFPHRTAVNGSGKFFHRARERSE